jgi:amidase
MGNSAGTLALADIPVDANAPLIDALVNAGALILGKTNLSEWANFRSTQSVSGWSSFGGQTRNARSYEHSPSGSSSGSAAAIAANFSVAAIGTETDGSIVSPSAHNGIVGLKPTVSRISQTGIIPISWSQDTAGPMTKTVKDAAMLLEVLQNSASNEAKTVIEPIQQDSFTEHCNPEYIKGKRIGCLAPDEQFPSSVRSAFESMIDALKSAGAICIPIEPVPTQVTLQDHEITQMCCEFPEGLTTYIKTRRSLSPYKTLRDFYDFNEAHSTDVMPLFKQEWFEKSLTMPPTSSIAYQQAQEHIQQYREELEELWFKFHDLDAMVCPTNGPAWRIDPKHNDRYTGGNSHIAAVTGWPSITVPFAKVGKLPLGALFITRAWEEAQLIGIAFGFEYSLQPD